MKKMAEKNQGGIKCWWCNGPHYFRDFLHKVWNTRALYDTQEGALVDDIDKMPWNSVALNNHQVDHQQSMVEEEGKV